MSEKKNVSRGQLLQLSSKIVQCVPADMSASAAQYWIDNPEALQAAVRKTLMPSAEASEVILPASQWWTLFTACQQQASNPVDFAEKNFPLEPVARDEDEWRVYEHYFPEQVTGEEACTRLKGMGLRLLIGVRRAFEFIAQNLHLQLDHPVAVTAPWRNLRNGELYIPIFDNIDGKRVVRLRDLSRKFRAQHGWLALERVSR